MSSAKDCKYLWCPICGTGETGLNFARSNHITINEENINYTSPSIDWEKIEVGVGSKPARFRNLPAMQAKGCPICGTGELWTFSKLAHDVSAV